MGNTVHRAVFLYGAKIKFDLNSAASFYFFSFLDILQLFCLAQVIEKCEIAQKGFRFAGQTKSQSPFCTYCLPVSNCYKARGIDGIQQTSFLRSTLMWFVSNSFSFGCG